MGSANASSGGSLSLKRSRTDADLKNSGAYARISCATNQTISLIALIAADVFFNLLTYAFGPLLQCSTFGFLIQVAAVAHRSTVPSIVGRPSLIGNRVNTDQLPLIESSKVSIRVETGFNLVEME